MKINSRWLIVLIITILVSGIVVVDAQISQTDEKIIYAAYNRNNGNLRFIMDGSIRKNEIPISWNIVGPEGPQGPVGPQGEQGPAGPQGLPGASIEDLTPVVENLIAEQINTLNLQISNMQQQITDMEAKVTALESELGIPSGSQFTSQTVYVPFTELNMEPQVGFTYYSEPGVVEIGQHGYYSVSITSLREGQVKAYVPDGLGGISMIQVTVSADGAIDYNIIPWVEGSVGSFTLSELNLFGSVTVSESNPDVVDVIDVLGVYNVFALSEGSTVITVIDAEGKEARIEVTVDQNRSITTFTVFPYVP